MDCHKLRILIVEDVKIAQKIAVKVLQLLACDVDTADTGSEALEQYGRHLYDFIFMDLGLPDMDGITATETIRKMEKKTGHHAIIIALTAHSDENFRLRSTEAGMDGFMVKPLTVETAQQIIDQYANNSRPTGK